MAAPDSKLAAIMKPASWVLVAALTCWSLYLMSVETGKIIGGQRKRMTTVGQTDLSKARKLLSTMLCKNYELKPDDLTYSSKGRAELNITTSPKVATEIVERAADFDFALRELRVEKVICHTPDEKAVFTYVTSPNFLGFGVSPDLILADRLKETAAASGLRSIMLSEANRHVERYLNADPTDPALIVDQAIVREISGGDIKTQTEKLAAVGSDSSEGKQKRAVLAQKLLAVLKCDGSADELAETIKTTLPRDYFRTYLLARTYSKFNDKENEKLALDSYNEERELTNRLCAVMTFAVVGSLAVLAFALTRREKLWKLPELNESMLSPVVFGWWKPMLVAFVSASISIVLLVVIYINCPPLLITGGSTLIAAFDPTKLSLLEFCDQMATTIPLILFAYLFIGMKLPFLEFVRLKFSCDGFELKKLVSLGIQGFGFCWTLANISMLLSLWFHFPGDTATTVGIGLIASSGKLDAIIWLFVGTALFAPITEEIIFRGILHPALRRHWNVYPSMIFGSLIFALVHGEFTPWWMLHKFFLGYVNVYLLEKTGSIVPGIINHMLINTFVVLFLILCS